MKLGGEEHFRDFHCSLTHASYVRTGGWTSQCNLHITGFQNVSLWYKLFTFTTECRLCCQTSFKHKKNNFLAILSTNSTQWGKQKSIHWTKIQVPKQNRYLSYTSHPWHHAFLFLRRLIEEGALKARGVFTGSVRPIKRM